MQATTPNSSHENKRKVVNHQEYDFCEAKWSGPRGTCSQKMHWRALNEGEHPGVICACGADKFKIAYTDSYETTAICDCGNKFVVHSG